MRAVNFAREQGLLLAIRGGGHNGPGWAPATTGWSSTSRAMNGIRVDPARSTARVGGGAPGADLDHATAAFGLATPSGIVSTTGVGGLTLGGGLGLPHARPTGSPSTTCSRPTSCSPTAARSRQRRPSTPTSSGRCAAAAATSAWSPRSSSDCTRLAVLRRPDLLGRRPGEEVLRYRDFIPNAPRELTGSSPTSGAPGPPFPEELAPAARLRGGVGLPR